MRHRLGGLSTYGLKDQCAGDEYPTYAPLEYGPPLPFSMYTVTGQATDSNAPVQLMTDPPGVSVLCIL